MPSMSPFTGAPFSLQSVTVQSPTALRLRYVNDPLAANPVGTFDGLNVANYSVTGPGAAVVVGASVVPADPQAIDLFLNVPLTTGDWMITVSNVKSVAADALSPPTSLNFHIDTFLTTESQNKGAKNDDAESLLRKHLLKPMRGRAWNALIAALATGDAANFENARLAFDMKFVSTAVQFYLDRKGADRGLTRPEFVGMSDEDYRQLIIKTTAKKLTAEVMYEILEIFYGSDATRAHITTEGVELFSLTDGDDFTVLIDETTSIKIIFHSDDFAVISAAKATEVAAVVTRQIRAQKIDGYAVAIKDPETGVNKVRIYSPSLGLGSAMRVTGGKAQNVLKFSELLRTNGTNPGVQSAQNWAITIPQPGIMRLTLAAASTSNLSLVHIGDYVNIYGTNFNTANRGSFPIINVDVRYVAGTLTQFIEVQNSAVQAQGSVAIAVTTDLLFFRPTKQTINGSRAVVVSQTTDNVTNVQLPATTTAVKRHKTSGAYLHARPTQTPTAISRFKGTTTVDFAAPHGLLAGQFAFLDNIYPTNTLPAVTAGNGTSTTDASRVSPWSVIGNAANAASEVAGVVIGNDAFVVGGDQVVAGPTDNGAQTFHQRFSIISSTILADGSTRYTYANGTVAALPAGRYRHACTPLTDAFNTGRYISTGGCNTATVSQTTAWIYDPVGDAWSAAMNMATARQNHAQSMLLDRRLLVTGGQDAASANVATTEFFTASGVGAGAFTAGPTMNIARGGHVQVTLSDGRVLVVGGVSTVIEWRNEIWDPSINAWRRTGDMAYKRFFPGCVKLPDDRVLIIGGGGRPTHQPIAGFVALDSAEIWDPKTGRFSLAGFMNTARLNPQAHYLPALNKVVVFGSGGKTEFYDVATGKWSRAPRTDTTIEDLQLGFGGVLANGTVFVSKGMVVSTGLSKATQRLWVPESNTLASGGLSGRLHKIASVPGPNSLTVSTPDFTEAMIGASPAPTMLPATALADTTFPGPFIYDPIAGVGITETATTTTVALNQGGQYASLKVVDASQFPETGGYLVLAFGTKRQVSPLRFLGKISNTELILDFSTKMSATLPIGTVVTLLVDKGPFVPENPEDVGSFYLTASSAGRVAASKMIDDVAAAGFEVNKTILYPGDKGLGGAGLPAEEAQKLSDKVGVWAGDDVDVEVQEAREGI